MSATRWQLITSMVGVSLLASSCVSAAGQSVDVTGTETGCLITTTEVQAGRVDFEFTNEASDLSELYVLRANGDVVGEVENIATGTSRTLAADLVAGEYQVRCIPGQTGDGFSSSFSAVGAGGTALAEASRSITFESVDFTYEALDLSTITAGETIRFEMKNKGAQPHEFEVLNADGEALGEVASTASGESGGATITFAEPGTYTYQCILVDPETGKLHTELGMAGTFLVP